MAQLFNLYLRVVRALDEIDAPYMIVGAFAGAVFGVVRSPPNFPYRAIMLTLK